LVLRKRRSILGVATINDTRYCTQLQRLAAYLSKESKWRGKICFHHGNGKPHVAKMAEAELNNLK